MKSHVVLPETASLTTDADAELSRLVARYQNAGGVGFEILNALGTRAESVFDQLPPSVRDGLDAATKLGARPGLRPEHGSRKLVGDRTPWINRAMASALGAAGGAGGVPSALVELPVTTMVLLRAIQAEAVSLGFDPESENVQFDCVQVFGAAGPLSRDDGADLAFMGTRLALSSGAMQTLIAKVVPKLAVVFGQKIAMQAVPVIGAMTGAATNYAFISYYQNVAHVHFGLRRLSIESGRSHEDLVAELNHRMTEPSTP